jgi:hypothetical protein
MLPPVEGALYGPFIAGRTAMATGDFRQFMGVKLATFGGWRMRLFVLWVEMKHVVVLKRAIEA